MFNCFFNSFQYEGGFNSHKSSLLFSSNLGVLFIMVLLSLEVIFIVVVLISPFNNWILLSLSLLSLNIVLIPFFTHLFS